MKYILPITIIAMMFLFSPEDAFGQRKELKKARSSYEDEDYYMASKNYADAIELGAELGLDDKLKLGHCYYELNEISRVYDLYNPIENDLTGDYIFYYASAIHNLPWYEEAIKWYQKAKLSDVKSKTVSEINQLIESCKWADNNDRNLPWRVNPCFPLATQGQSFGVQYYKNKVVYSSAADEDSDQRDQFGKPFLNLYTTDLDSIGNAIEGSARVFSQNLLSPYHVGAISFTSDLLHMYFTKTEDVDGESRVRIYLADYDGSDWSNARLVSFIKDDFDYAHPAVSPDDKYLFFVSNRNGGFGGKDIWYVEILGPNKFSSVKNCGKNVNTFEDEVYPVINQDGKLYFSSRGHFGFGGLDIFSAELIAGKWQNVQNMLKPFNSQRDDFCYVQMPGEPRRGFLSSNNYQQGLADVIFTVVDKSLEPDEPAKQTSDDDMMFFDDDMAFVPMDEPTPAPVTEPEPVTVPEPEPQPEVVPAPAPVVEEVKPYIFSVDVISSYNNEKVVGANVLIVNNATGGVLGDGISDTDGHALITIDGNVKKQNPDIVIKVSKEGYNSRNYDTSCSELDQLSREGLRLTPIFNDQVLDDISGMEITYGKDLDDNVKNMLDKLAAYLLQNPNIVVKVNAHTEAKGNRYGNLSVSQGMADKAVEYIVSKGVNKDQLIPRGYGERYLKNRCHRGIYCDKAQHAENRRIEIVVWNVRH
ncbi:MAG: OmpA family protein [Bacteroidales bacterium]|nr:OmpA family protein [Bacteroidales bacterium]